MTADHTATMESGIRLNAMFAEKEAQLKGALDQACRLKGDCAVLAARNESLTKMLAQRDKEIADLRTPAHPPLDNGREQTDELNAAG